MTDQEDILTYEPDTAADEPGAGRKQGAAVRILLVLVCAFLLAGSVFLAWKDEQRAYRHGVYRCANGRLLAEPVSPDPDVIADTASGIHALAAAYPHITQYMMVIPSTVCIQSRYLPEGAVIRDQEKDLNAIRTAMGAGLHWIDLVTELQRHEGEKLYYTTDIRLTGWGSRYAARAALAEMDAPVPEGGEKCYLLSDSLLGNLAEDGDLLGRLTGSQKERLEIYVPEDEAAYYRVDAATGKRYGSFYDAEAAAGADPFDVFLGGDRPLTQICTTMVNGRKLLVVGNRSADSIVPLLISSFEEIIFVHTTTCTRSVSSIVREYGPTDILYLYDADSFMQDGMLARALQ